MSLCHRMFKKVKEFTVQVNELTENITVAELKLAKKEAEYQTHAKALREANLLIGQLQGQLGAAQVFLCIENIPICAGRSQPIELRGGP